MFVDNVFFFSLPFQPLFFRRFNIYIHDYCFKRGFRKTARELMTEAEIPPDSAPPINARQGLLFEYASAHLCIPRVSHLNFRWWSVFWVLFTAKANGHGPDEAMVYAQVRGSSLSLPRCISQPLFYHPSTKYIKISIVMPFNIESLERPYSNFPLASSLSPRQSNRNLAPDFLTAYPLDRD